MADNRLDDEGVVRERHKNCRWCKKGYTNQELWNLENYTRHRTQKKRLMYKQLGARSDFKISKKQNNRFSKQWEYCSEVWMVKCGSCKKWWAPYERFVD